MSAQASARPTLKLIEGGAGKRRTAWCDRLPGFGLRRYASGRASYIVQSLMGGRTRTITLGRAGTLSEHQARELARHTLLRCQVGQDPAAVRVTARTAPAFDDFAAEYFRRMEPRWKPATRTRNDEHRRCHIVGAFPGAFIDTIDTADVQRWFVRVSDRDGPGAANRALAVLSAMFGRAEVWGYRSDGSNPCTGLRRNRPRGTARVLEPAEIARLGQVLDATAARQPMQSAAVRLLLLTGCRRSEVLALRWSDWRGERLSLRDAKAGPRTVWLGAEARAALASVPRGRGDAAIFANEATGRALVSIDRYWRKVRVEAALPPTRLHDLRHTFASYAARGSEAMPLIGRLLGHRALATTARYAKLDDASLVSASEAIGEFVSDALGVRS